MDGVSGMSGTPSVSVIAGSDQSLHPAALCVLAQTKYVDPVNRSSITSSPSELMVNSGGSSLVSLHPSSRSSIGTAPPVPSVKTCLLYTSDAADERSSVDLG